jgi:glycosyltransferase involved in cell wall biosynthesis
MPVVVKEAMAMELMVVATTAVGLPECVREPWGRLVAPGDPEALRAALEEVLALSPDERACAGAAGRVWVLENADVHRETARLAQLISDVAS